MADITTDENSVYWREYWEQATQLRRKDKGPMHPAFWNRMAGRLSGDDPDDREDRRLNATLDLIESTGLDLAGAEVLDIGAGTGSLAIPLARRGARVTAVDFSEKMLKQLKERAAREGVSIARTLQVSWDEIDLDTEGLRGQFDLVIASMTPAVRCPETFGLMQEAARGICYYRGWVNRKWDPAFYELYRLLFDEEFPMSSHGLSFPLIDLYLKGYRPTVKISQEEWVAEETVDDTVERISGFFSSTKDIDEAMKDRMREYLRARAKDGKYTSKTVATTAMMVWDVNERCG